MINDSKVNVDGLTINTRRSGEGRDTILFVHGNSCSSEFWNSQLNNLDLRQDFSLIAIDLPGHGDSGRSDDYSLKFLADVLARTIQELSLNRYVLVGLSYGTALIAETAPKLKNCNGYFLASPNITSDDFPPNRYIIPFPELLTMISATVDKETLRRFAAHLAGDPSSPLVDEFCKSYEETDPMFRTDLGIAMQKASWSDEFKNLINSRTPVEYVFGEKDQAMDIHYMDAIKLPGNHKFHFLKDAGHFVNIDQADKFGRLLNAFCRSVL